MLRIAMIARSTLHTVIGGDTVQVLETAKYLRKEGVEVDIRCTDESIDYRNYDILHFFNLIRPADILFHVKKSGKRYVVSTVLVDYSEYDRRYRKGIMSFLFRMLPAAETEYIKTMTRWILGRDKLMDRSYAWRGQHASVRKVLKHAAMLLPNSVSEQQRIVDQYCCDNSSIVVPNGIDPVLFRAAETAHRDERLVLCVARIEGIKNQLNLIKALRNTEFRLLIIGSAAPNQPGYYKACRGAATDNIIFIDHLPQQQLLQYYNSAKVHVLPSFFETTGLSSLEAAAMGCRIVVTEKGDTRSYFGHHAFYCDPADPGSIYEAVQLAAAAAPDPVLQAQVLDQYNWKRAAEKTLEAYHTIMRS
jgi:glycosyltransferase involved in cell wall biosynthesis